MAIDNNKPPSKQLKLKEATGPALVRPDHDDDPDLEPEEGDFEDFSKEQS